MVGVFRLLVLALFGCLTSFSTFALSLEEIEQRFEQLERENADLKRKLEQVESVLIRQGIDPSDPLIEQRITASERRDQQVEKRMDKFEQVVNNDLTRISVDGFLSAGFSSNDESGGLNHRPYGFRQRSDFESDAVLGLQITFDVNEQAKVVTQVVANGWDNWQADIGWAYLAYDVTDQFAVRGGRMRLPFYLYSESLDVGYSYPWVRPPLTLYTTEISNYDGFDVTYSMRYGDATHRVSAFYGGYSFDENSHDKDVAISGDEVFGANFTTYWDDWTFRIGYSHLENNARFEVETAQFAGAGIGILGTCVPNVPGCSSVQVGGEEVVLKFGVSETINFYSYSTSYDDGTWLAILEAAVVEVGEASLIGDEVQGVFTLGRHWGKWMPYVGYGWEHYKQALSADKIFARTKDRDYKLNFLGLRYDITPGVAAKLEWNHYYDFKGTSGPFEQAGAFVNGDSFDAVNTYTFLIDAVF